MCHVKKKMNNVPNFKDERVMDWLRRMCLFLVGGTLLGLDLLGAPFVGFRFIKGLNIGRFNENNNGPS